MTRSCRDTEYKNRVLQAMLARMIERMEKLLAESEKIGQECDVLLAKFIAEIGIDEK